ncbi:MAG: hypothetical protein IJ955_10315 [Oscillospiraceae bacterium]|nr:hypothetical protein [Oscillospiraceae bacterium]
MAKMTLEIGEEFAIKLSQLADGSEEIAKKAIYQAAGIVTDQIRRNLEKNLSDSASAAKDGSARSKNQYNHPTGDLSRSLGITPIQRDNDGYLNARVGFDGYDRRGVPNQLKARVMESGSSTIKKRPFVRPAVNATKAAAVQTMEKVVEEEIQKIMEGKS